MQGRLNRSIIKGDPMDKIRGMLTVQELEDRMKRGELETVLVCFADQYGRLMGKRVEAEFFLSSVASHGMHACDYILTVDMEMDVVQGYKFSNWELGYGDFVCIPDLGTLRSATWLDKSAIILCDLVLEHGRGPVEIAPRTILKKQIERLENAGFGAMAASELEYFIFNETYSSAQRKNFHNLETYGSYIEDYHILQGGREEVLNAAVRRHMMDSGIPIESSKGEWGPGQTELNLRYCNILTMADRHVIYKQAVKEIASSSGLAVTFMAKWNAEHAGSSSHIHISLWDKKTGKNAFAGDHKISHIQCSDTFRYFLGGWLKHLPEITPFYAPYPNSYKRYQSQSWAPTSVAWSMDNRTSGFRVVGEGSSLRIEARFPGADVNPYLAYAASIAAGLDGIENRIEPPPPFSGDVYMSKSLPRVPKNLTIAVDSLEKSEMLKKAFGAEVVEHYVHFFRVEQDKFDHAVTDFERARYFERA